MLGIKQTINLDTHYIIFLYYIAIKLYYYIIICVYNIIMNNSLNHEIKLLTNTNIL